MYSYFWRTKINKDDQIRLRAHQIWEAAGRPDGLEVDHWQQAEEQLNHDDESVQKELPDMTALPPNETPDAGQADGHVITDGEGGLSDIPDEAQQAVDSPLSQQPKSARKPRAKKTKN